MQRTRILALMLALLFSFAFGACSDNATDNPPTDGDVPSDGDEPTDGDIPADGDLPTDGDSPIDGDEPVDGDTPTDGDSPADGDGKLRGYFCETDSDCGQGESCQSFGDAGARVCMPENFIRFTDAQTFIIDTSSLNPIVERGDSAEDQLKAKGFANISEPGNPNLPSLTFNVLLPPDSDLAQLSFEILSEENDNLVGSFAIAAAGPANWRPDLADSDTVEDYFAQRPYIENGYNTQVYNADAFWPAKAVQIRETSQMRKWKFARVQVFPFAFNPQSGKVRKTGFLKVHLTAPAATQKSAQARRASLRLLADTTFDRVAENLFVNFEQGAAAYRNVTPPPEDDDVAKSDYVILTTNRVVQASSALEAFVEHKKAIGYSVLVVTEDDYGDMEGVDSAERARNWLIAEYARRGIQYLLILADPNPNETGPFMRICWPRYNKEGKKDDWERTATDAYYADLTGNWNKDGDELWCEYGSSDGDTGNGGVDLTPELYVGRIPVYSGDTGHMDDILEATIAYELEKDIAWRYNVMLPNPISDFSREIDHDGEEVTRGQTVDGAKFAERMKRDFLNSSNNINTFSLYDTRGPEPSAYTPDRDFSEANVCDEWSKGYGITSWWAHGNSASAAGKTWLEDKNANGIAESNEKSWEDFAHNGMAAGCFNPAHPTHTSQVSCLNSRPDRSNNLGHYLLYMGGAITTMGATSVTLYTPSWTSPNSHRMDNVSFGYYYTEYLVKNYSAGRALAMVRSKPCSFSWGDGTLMNMLSFNVYGDPSVSVFTTYQTGGDSEDPNFAYNGHAFMKDVPTDDGPALRWDLYYTMDKVAGTELDVVIWLYDADQQAIQVDGHDLFIAHMYVLEDGALAYDGDTPDRFELPLASLEQLGDGHHTLHYQIDINTIGSGPVDLYTSEMTPFEIDIDLPDETPELTLDEPSEGELTEIGEQKLFRLSLEQAGRLTVALNGPESGADFDLYVKSGSAPGKSDFDGRGYTASASEQVVLDVAAGDIYILVHSYSGAGSFSLLASLQSDDAPEPTEDVSPLPLDEIVSGSLDAGTSALYRLNAVQAGTLVLLAEGDDGGTIQLYLRKDAAPTGDDFDASATADGNYQELETAIDAGSWYVRISAPDVATSYELYGWLE